jgi:hypothetical protein
MGGVFYCAGGVAELSLDCQQGLGNQTDCTPGVSCAYPECDYVRESALSRPIVKGFMCDDDAIHADICPGGWAVA